MAGIERRRARAFRTVLQVIDATTKRDRPSTKIDQEYFLDELITEHKLRVTVKAKRFTDPPVVVTPDAERLRSLLMAFAYRHGDDALGSDIFTQGSRAFSDEALGKIGWLELQEPAESTRTSNKAADTIAVSKTGRSAAPSGSSGGRARTSASRDLLEDSAASSEGSEPQLIASASKKTTATPCKKEDEQDQQKVAIPPRPTPSDLSTSPGLSGPPTAQTPLVVSSPPVSTVSLSSAVPAISTPKASTATVGPTLKDSSAAIPPKRLLEDPTPEQSIPKRPNNGKERAVEPSVGPVLPVRTFRSHPCNAPTIEDSDKRMEKVLTHIRAATYVLFDHYGIDKARPMVLPSRATPSHDLEALYDLAVGHKGQGWRVGARERVNAKENMAFFLQSVLCAGVYKRVFVNPVPWMTPHQFLQGIGPIGRRYMAEISRYQATVSGNGMGPFEQAVFNAGANMIRLNRDPPPGMESMHEEIINPHSQNSGEVLYHILRELFQYYIDARTQRPDQDLEQENSIWTQAAGELHLACKEALMLRGLLETVPVDVDIEWVRPGTKFDVKTMKALMGFRLGQLGVEEPFEVAMSFTPKVTSPPGQQWDAEGSCLVKGLVHIKPLNPSKK